MVIKGITITRIILFGVINDPIKDINKLKNKKIKNRCYE